MPSNRIPKDKTFFCKTLFWLMWDSFIENVFLIFINYVRIKGMINYYYCEVYFTRKDKLNMFSDFFNHTR